MKLSEASRGTMKLSEVNSPQAKARAKAQAELDERTAEAERLGRKTSPVSLGMDVADEYLGSAYDKSMQPYNPQGIPGEVMEAGLKGAGAITPGGRMVTERFLKDPKARAAMGIGAGLIQAPAATIGGMALGGLAHTFAPEGRKNIAGTIGGLAGGKAGLEVGKFGQQIAGKMASGIINSMIRPKNKSFQYGKNPGKEVAKQGIKGNSLEQLGENISKRSGELYAKLKSKITPGKTVDVQAAVDPIHEEIAALKRQPETNSAAISKLEGLARDIMGVVKNKQGRIVSKRSLSKLSGEEALQLKQDIGNTAKWSASDAPPVYQKVMHKVYHALDTAMEGVFPGMKALNKSIANLIGAEQAIPAAVAASKKTPLFGLGSLKTVGAGLLGGAAGGGPAGAITGVVGQKLLASPATGTRIASGLAKIGKLK